MRPLPFLGSRGILSSMISAAAALSLVQFNPSFDSPPTSKPRDFWKNARYPLSELRRLAAERGCGSVRRIDASVRETFERTERP